jgi:DNA repair protein RecO (recombination protein O)
MSTLANAAEIPATEMPATETPVTVTPPSETPAIKTPAIKAPTSSVRAPRTRAPERDHRIVNQPGFVLHSYPYKETSLIIDLFSRDHGRVALVAKGAKRPHSKLRGVLQTFQPLQLAWVGKSEVRTLVSAEWVGGLLPLEGAALLCGFYLNELLVKLLARDDPHAPLFDHYMSALNQLAHDEPPAIVLRKFELSLLKETGVAGNLAVCAQTGQPVDVEKTYVIDPERGARASLASDTSPSVTGKTLLDMEAGDYSDSTTQLQSKFLMRHLLSHHLGGMPLNTRQILIDLLQL